MRGFIEIRDEFGNARLLNTRYIEEVREHSCDDTCTIYLAFNCPDAGTQDYVVVRKPYKEIVALIEKAVE